MKSQPEIKFLGLLENIRHDFAFLFGRGFQVVSVIFIDQNYEDWQVTMATDDCIIKLYTYMGKTGLALSIPQLYEAVGLLELNDLLYGVNEDEDFSDSAKESPIDETQRLCRIARLLEKHLDQILERIGKMLVLLSFDDPAIPSSSPGHMFPYN